MKYSYNWLKKLSNTKKSPEEVASLLTMHSFELEGIEKIGQDTIIELDILANRGHDAMSHLSMAREICTLEGRYLDTKDFDKLKMPTKKSAKIKIEIQDAKLCPRYIGVVMEDIEVKESPAWLKAAMHNLGMNSINNIVDATNYVMLEIGQPLHAFDLDRVESDKILVRCAKEGEEIDLLDKGVIKLTKDDLLITNGQRPAALAGIKGGHIAEIDNSTKNIILEAANFNPTAVRKTRMRLGLPTDAALRFEKGLDPNLAELAIKRAVEIIEDFSGKTEGIVDVYPNPVKPWRIELNLGYVSKLLGEKIKDEEIIRILKLLGLSVNSHQSSDEIVVEIPTIRLDLQNQEDLIEEIGRIYGYENIKSQVPHAPVRAAKPNEVRLFDRALKNILVGAGFSEVYNYSFYSRLDADRAMLGTIYHLELENPMNPDQALLRVSLIPNILKNVRENLKNFKEFNIFEIGRVYWPANNSLPEEKRMLVGVIAQTNKKQATSFFEAKGAVDILLGVLGITDFYYDSCEATPDDTMIGLWHPSRIAEIKIEGQNESIGFLGEISPLVLTDFNIREKVSMFELDLEKLQKFSEEEREYLPIRKHPTIVRDISLVINGDTTVDDVLKVIQKAGGDLVLDTDLFDMYELETGGMSLAFHIIFGADNRTLKNTEVEILMKKIITTLEANLKVLIRR